MIALCFSLVVMISSSSSVFADTDQSYASVNNTIAQTVTSNNLAWVEIDCSLTPTFNSSSFGNLPGNETFMPGQFGNGNFTPGQFGSNGFLGNFTPGQFGPFGNFSSGQFFNGTIPDGFGSSLMGGETIVMNETLYSDISSIAGVVAVAPMLQVSENQNQTTLAVEGNFTRFTSNYVILGVPLSSSIIGTYPILPINITAGRNLQAGDSGVVVISESNSEYFDASVGDAITLFGRPFEVVGIHGGSEISTSQTLYMSLSDAQSLTNNTGNVTSLKVFAESKVDVASVVNAIRSLHPELSVVNAQDFGISADSTSSPSTPSVQQSTSSSDVSYLVAVAAIVVILLVIAVVMFTKRRKAKSYNIAASSSSAESPERGAFSFFNVSISELRTNLGTILVNCLNSKFFNEFSKLKGDI